MKPKRRIASLTGCAALLGAGALAGALPAEAAPGDGGTGSITVHKFEQPLEGDLGPNDGSEIPDTGSAVPLPEVGFSICVIQDIRLSEAADWDRLSGITATFDGQDLVVSEGADPLTCTTPTGVVNPVRTNSDGMAQFGGLNADQAYVVWESNPPPGALYTMDPTVVSLPFPGSGDGEAWNYNVHLYPKNVLPGSGATKNAEIIGNNVTFRVNAPVNNLGVDPGTGTPRQYTEFQINDQLSGALTYNGSSVVLHDATGNEVNLQQGTHYTLTENNGLVTLLFLDAGLAVLDENIGGEVILTITAGAAATGSTANTANIKVNGVGAEVQVADPEDFFSGAHVMKEALNRGSDDPVTLAGATFQLFTGEGLTTCPETVEAAQASLTPVDTGEGPFVSGDDGQTPFLVLAAGNYCVYETGVPAGYRGVTTGTLLTVEGENASVTLTNQQFGREEGDLPDLPLTGAQATQLLVILGGVMLLTGTALLVARRRRSMSEK